MVLQYFRKKPINMFWTWTFRISRPSSILCLNGPIITSRMSSGRTFVSWYNAFSGAPLMCRRNFSGLLWAQLFTKAMAALLTTWFESKWKSFLRHPPFASLTTLSKSYRKAGWGKVKCLILEDGMHILLLIIESAEFYDLHANISPKQIFNLRIFERPKFCQLSLTIFKPVIFCKVLVLQQLFFQGIQLEHF